MEDERLRHVGRHQATSFSKRGGGHRAMVSVRHMVIKRSHRIDISWQRKTSAIQDISI